MFSLSDARAIADLSEEAGRIILAIRAAHLSETKDWSAENKKDGTPVTRADHESQAHILAGLARLGLKGPVVAEESDAPAIGKGCKGFYLIDPLDGTRAFVNGGEDFTVNIGFADFSLPGGRPILGVVHVPMTGETYFGAGNAAFYRKGGVEEKIAARRADSTGVDVIVNRTEDWSGRLSGFLKGLQLRELKRLSSAQKLGLVARGLYDLYPRFGPTYEWDIAAGDAILRAAGGTVETMDGADLTYNKPGFRNPPFVARGLKS